MQSKPLPDSWIKSLLDRMAAMYGEKFVRQWEKTDPSAMREMWANALGRYDGEQIKWALLHLVGNNPFPPTLPEFVILCRQAPRSEIPSLPAPVVPQEVARARAAEIEAASRKIAAKPQDFRKWARDILANPRVFPPYSVKCAQEAMGCDAEYVAAR